MSIELLTPRYRRDPNEKIESMYSGVAPGGRTVTTVVKPSVDRNQLEKTRIYGPGLPRGEGGHIATIILAGMETSLDEVESILGAKREERFVPRRSKTEIAEMCWVMAQWRDDAIRHWQKNPSEKPPLRKRRPTLLLPVRARMVPTDVPGLQVRQGA